MRGSREFEGRRVAKFLKDRGVEVESVFDLLGRGRLSEEAIEPLLEVLPTISDGWILQGAVRALTDRKARGRVAGQLFELVDRSVGSGDIDVDLVWAIGNALKQTATKEDLKRIRLLLEDSRLGAGRQTLIEAAAKLHDSEAVPILARLLEDPDLQGQAAAALGKLGARESIPRISLLRESPNPWVRSQAKKAIAALSRAGDELKRVRRSTAGSSETRPKAVGPRAVPTHRNDKG